MGNGCSPCCTKCCETICCCSPCCIKCCRPTSSKATSPMTMPIKKRGASPMPPQLADTWEIKLIQTDRIDISSLNRIAEGVDFSDIVNEKIMLGIDTKKKAIQQDLSIKSRLNMKLAQNGPDWHDKLFIHGRLSDIVADVRGQTHGCINSAISEDMDRNLLILHDINTAAAAVLQDRLTKIASREKSSIDQFIQERDVIINTLLERGRSYVNQYENDYRELIRKYITTLEVEMSKHLDYLQSQIESDRISVFQGVNTRIQRITDEADRARDDFHQLLLQTAASKRQAIIDLIENSSADKTSQPLGYEQLKKFNIEVYSTVGKKNDGQGCENIPDRAKFIADIDRVKPFQPRIKRTVYMEQNIGQQ